MQVKTTYLPPFGLFVFAYIRPMKKELPIGVQDFRELRQADYLYIDKTKYLKALARGKYYFLSRPRRFGKSLLISTLEALFSGQKELFEGLWIEDQWDWTQCHPVLKINFSSIGYQTHGLEKALCLTLEKLAQKHQITRRHTDYILGFQELIEKLAEKSGRVVLLIDEYDKPIIDYLDDLPKAQAHRQILKGFYSILKEADPQLRMIFLTGISKFSKTSIFSDLNNLQDLSLHPRFNAMLGITQEELERDLSPYAEPMLKDYASPEAFYQKVRLWYNGYNWTGEEKLYNPFSILNFFHSQKFRNYWFETATPSFLITLLRKQNVYALSEKIVDFSAFSSYELDRISAITLLFQTGYITIKEEMEMGLVKVGYPNREVEESMLNYLVLGYTDKQQGQAVPALLMAQALQRGDLDELHQQINHLLADIPYDLHQNQESYYHTVMYLAFSLIGIHVQAEVHHARGRLDAVVKTAQGVYLFEFKVNSTAKKALEQIQERGYADSYRGKTPVWAIGMSFSTETKQVEDWKVEVVG